MKKLNPNKEESLEFFIEVSGASLDSIKPRLLIHDKDITYCFQGQFTEQKNEAFSKFFESKEKSCIFKIPKLAGLVKNENLKAEIEIMLEDRFYVPWSSDIELEKQITFNIKESTEQNSIKIVEKKEIEAPKVKETTILGETVNVKTKSGKKIPLFIEKIIKEEKDYYIVEVTDFNNIKKVIKYKKGNK